MDCVLSNELVNAVFSSSFVMIVSRNGLENRKRSNELVESLRLATRDVNIFANRTICNSSMPKNFNNQTFNVKFRTDMYFDFQKQKQKQKCETRKRKYAHMHGLRFIFHHSK